MKYRTISATVVKPAAGSLSKSAWPPKSQTEKHSVEVVKGSGGQRSHYKSKTRHSASGTIRRKKSPTGSTLEGKNSAHFKGEEQNATAASILVSNNTNGRPEPDKTIRGARFGTVSGSGRANNNSGKSGTGSKEVSAKHLGTKSLRNSTNTISSDKNFNATGRDKLRRLSRKPATCDDDDDGDQENTLSTSINMNTMSNISKEEPVNNGTTNSGDPKVRRHRLRPFLESIMLLPADSRVIYVGCSILCRC